MSKDKQEDIEFIKAERDAYKEDCGAMFSALTRIAALHGSVPPMGAQDLAAVAWARAFKAFGDRLPHVPRADLLVKPIRKKKADPPRKT